ncbi:peptidylprolyl isomerase [Sphingomonas sp. ASV193]|uniref:peptidylprolyl isomerase n=1 Tax=Sphingomonas sp. ASV193 TaxID=3144405 RepID=UPI0032E8F795
MPILTALLLAAAPPPATPKIRSPGDAVKAARAADWAEIPADELMVMDLANGKRVVIQLAPIFAPVHVANLKIMARAGYWGRATVYRVVDNWVTQWGLGDGPFKSPPGVIDRPPEEYQRSARGLTLTPMGSPDPYSSMAAYTEGWPVAKQPGGIVNAAYCYGTVGVARDAAPDTGNGSELFTVIGATARRLDRNYALVGRVIEGMEYLSALPRGTADMGVYAKDQSPLAITSVRIAADMPAGQRPRFEYLKSGSPAFADYVQLASHRRDYGVPSPGADLCAVPVPVRKVGVKS